MRPEDQRCSERSREAEHGGLVAQDSQGLEGGGHGGLVCEAEAQAAEGLDEEGGKHEATEAVRDVDMHWHELGEDVISQRLDLVAFFKPVIEHGWAGRGAGLQ